MTTETRTWHRNVKIVDATWSGEGNIQQSSVAVTDTGDIVPGTELHSEYINDWPAVVEPTYQTTRRVASVGWMCYPWSCNYQHWLIEDLPRVRRLQGIGIGAVIDRNVGSWAAEALDILGVPFFKRNAGERILVSDLLVPNFRSLNFKYISEECRAVYDELRDRCLQRAAYVKKWPEVFYVSRRNKSSHWHNRTMLNEGRLVVALAYKDIPEIFTDNLSLFDEICLFANAKLVIGAVGAGMSNLVFAPNASAVVIEHPRLDGKFYESIARKGCTKLVSGSKIADENSSGVNVPWECDIQQVLSAL